MKSLTAKQSPGSDSEEAEQQVQDQRMMIPSEADTFNKKNQTWFITSQIPTDLKIQVQDITFNVHKYTLISKCGYIGRLVLQPSISTMGYDLKLENFPGGSDTFEMILKYCYGFPVDLNPSNIAPLRCASEFLEMTEEFEDGNLISKTESFLTFVVLLSCKETVTVLKTCQSLSPWAENLQIVRRCCDSIARKFSRENFTEDIVHEDRSFNHLITLRIDHFTRIITAVRAKDVQPEMVGKIIEHYAMKWLPGIDMEIGLEYDQEKNDLQMSILSGKKEELEIGCSKEHKAIIESLLSIMPPQREAVSCKFLLQMLKMARLYSASPALISELEKRIGMVLEDASVNDLLIPSYPKNDQRNLPHTQEDCTMHDIEVVQRILEYYSLFEQQEQQQTFGNSTVCKILDNYLAELARDPNLSIIKFQTLANLLTENARNCHDGLYRAIDTYLKTHPLLSEHDRRKLCKIINCKKLSLDACVHAAQNDRLPLRTIVQVLFSEQMKMRAAMEEKEKPPSSNNSEQDGIGNHSSTDREIKTLRAELDNVKGKMAELQNDYSELQQEYDKLSNKHKNLAGWSLGWKKIKNSFHVRVDGDETGHQRRSRTSSRISLRRRLSMT